MRHLRRRTSLLGLLGLLEALAAVLEPHLHRARCESESLAERLALLRVGHLVELVEARHDRLLVGRVGRAARGALGIRALANGRRREAVDRRRLARTALALAPVILLGARRHHGLAMRQRTREALLCVGGDIGVLDDEGATWLVGAHAVDALPAQRVVAAHLGLVQAVLALVAVDLCRAPNTLAAALLLRPLDHVGEVAGIGIGVLKVRVVHGLGCGGKGEHGRTANSSGPLQDERAPIRQRKSEGAPVRHQMWRLHLRKDHRGVSDTRLLCRSTVGSTQAL